MKTIIYCTKEKPYLTKTYEQVSVDMEIDYYELLNKVPQKEKNISRKILNGTVCAMCEVNDIYKLKYGRWVNHRVGDWNYRGYNDEHLLTFKKACLTEKEINDYGKGKDIYAYHLENVQPIDLKLSDLGLKRAPQSWQYVFYKGELCLLISIKSKWVAKILNGEKTIEARTTAPRKVLK